LAWSGRERETAGAAEEQRSLSRYGVKILFGTCAPEMDPRVGKEALRLLKLPPDRYAKVAGLNFQALISRRA
jgi:hypothetical protein